MFYNSDLEKVKNLKPCNSIDYHFFIWEVKNRMIFTVNYSEKAQKITIKFKNSTALPPV